MHKIKSKIRESKYLLYIVAFIYSIPDIFRNIIPIMKCRIVISGVFLRNVKFKCSGKNIKVSIGSGAVLNNCSFYCDGDNILIRIEGTKTRIKNTRFYVEDNNSCIVIGECFTMEGGHIASTEGQEISIGNDCMFSNDIEIRNGDSHAICLNDDGRRINDASKVFIGNHVWLCAHSRVMKGTIVADNCILGNSAVASGKLDECNSIYAGSPAKFMKRGIKWSRERSHL